MVGDAEYAALAEFRYQIRRFMRFSEQAARDAGIEPQQHQLLLAAKAVVSHATPTVGELAERLQIQHHSAVELINRTVAKGLIRRTRDGGDRRQVRVELTPRGERLLRDLSLHHREALSDAAPALAQALYTLTSELKSGANRARSRGRTAARKKQTTRGRIRA
jgi:DNA-binding MarR family transcriptional regulator